MTVIVKDMMLPDCCAVCELSDSDDDGIYCNVLEEFMRFDELPKGRRSDCPLFDENTETIQSIVLNDRYGNIAEYAKVIRCKDCKYNSNTEGNYVNCAIIPQMFGKTADNNFCSYAEPKETT